ncbi:hypothetical protein T01_12186 [Trichinella spiralis]|uniref:Uncharacterized protein n=1 Tax=Trichinella spiralis TaxID=6334 RepID=A0A0V1BP17_TRISP|nr:hypothetical protein T01_12186 [Trichinella spiralis]
MHGERYPTHKCPLVKFHLITIIRLMATQLRTFSMASPIKSSLLRYFENVNGTLIWLQNA